MKIHQWIDKYNYKNNFKILRKYSHGLASGRPQNFYLHTSFFGKYMIRLLLVLASLITFKGSTYKTLFQLLKHKYSPYLSPEKNSVPKMRFVDFAATLFGFRYFADPTLLPLLKENEISKRHLEFQHYDQPLVSLVIPVYNHLDYTYNCLKSLSEKVSNGVAFEVVVIDDCSTDLTALFFKNNVKGITYIKNEINRGFIHSCNLGAKGAKGELICFLNNDVQVSHNWLETLVETLQSSDVGCVGSKLIYANGLLQEAGGYVFSDASAANYGRYSDPNDTAYNYMREVDYCSGASIMVRKHDLEVLGYFDQRYVPAYYEDTDICFAIRHRLGKKVVYQPLSTVIHFEGISSGTDEDKDPIKGFQKINKIKFAEKWSAELASYTVPGNIEKAIQKYIPSKTVLFIDDAIPTPDKDSGSLRLIGLMKIVKSLGYHIIFVPDNGERDHQYFNALVLMGVEVLYRFPNRKSMLANLSKKMEKVDVAWICKFHNNTNFEFIFELNKNVKRIFDTIDLHYLRLHREALLTMDAVALSRADAVKSAELEQARKADLTIAITPEERLLLEKEGIENLVVISNVHENNTDETLFKPFKERSGLIFIGGYAHKPNIDCARWLVEEIMPKVWERDPSIKLILLGSNPSNEVLQLTSPQVSVPGYIADVSPFFNNARVFVSPLRFGAGMKGKIGQSLSFGLPIVTTEVGAEGIDLTPGENYLLASTAQDFANEIWRLYHDEALWNQLSTASKEVIRQYHPERIKATIATFLPDLNEAPSATF